MKLLIVFGLCIAVVLSSPLPDDNDGNDDQSDQLSDHVLKAFFYFKNYTKPSPRGRRRFQTLSLKLVDDHDGERNNLDRDDDDNVHDRRDDLGPLRNVHDRRDDLASLREVMMYPTYTVEALHPQVAPKEVYNQAKSSHLELLARELERLSAKYQGRGVLKVAYSPSKHRNPTSKLHDLGSLHFKYVTPQEKLVHPYHHYEKFEQSFLNQYKPSHGYLRDSPDDDDDDNDNNNNDN